MLYMSSNAGIFYIFDVRGNGEFTQKEKLHSDILIDFTVTKEETYAITAGLDGTINLAKIIKLN
jgi:hypothetical protein